MVQRSLCIRPCHPTSQRTLQKRIGQAGRPDVEVLDAPFSGTPEKSQQGKLLVVLAGSTPRIDRLTPYLQTYASETIHVGALGTASHMKLLHNSIGGVNLVVAAWIMGLGDALGLDQKFLFNLVMHTDARSVYFENRVPQLLEAGTSPSARMTIWTKDLALALSSYQQYRDGLPLILTCLDTFQTAVDQGLGDAADTDVIRIWRAI